MEMPIKEAVRQGVAAHKEGKLMEAYRIYTAILNADPKHPDANHNIGVLAVSVGEVERALPHLKAALEANSEIEQFWVSYVSALIKLGQFSNAKKVLEQSKNNGLKGEGIKKLQKELNGKDNTFREEKIDQLIALYNQGLLSEALTEGNALADTFPEDFAVYSILGAINATLGNYEKSISSYEKAIKLKPGSIESYISLGISLNKLGRFEEAITCYKKVTKLVPNRAEAYNNLGNNQNEISQFEEAIASYTKAIELKPDYAEAYNNLGNAFHKLGRYEKAIASYTEATEITHDFAVAYYNLGHTFNKLNRYEEVIDSCTKAIELNPAFSEAYNSLGNALHELGKYEEAFANCNRAIVLKANFFEAYNNLGNATIGLGMYQQAIGHFNKAIELNPVFSEAYNNLGNAEIRLVNHENSITNYKKAIAIQPDFSKAYWNKHGLCRDIADATNILLKSSITDCSNPESQIVLAGLMAITGSANDYLALTNPTLSAHQFKTSFDWFLQLEEAPRVYYDRWHFFDDMIAVADKSRPFYEYGVWMGVSFRYLIKAFGKGFGFDTFAGLPEDWHSLQKGTYSSGGLIPDIRGGEFIVGKFADTLPKFFAEERQKASIINFDADLYSSTICALRNSRSIIDEKTILIFDEFIATAHWQHDEYKALNDFCAEFELDYEVLAVSFFTNQAAVRIVK